MSPTIRLPTFAKALLCSTPTLATATIENDLDVRIVNEPLDQILVKRRFAA